MARTNRLTDNQIAEALKQSHGFIATAATMLGYDRATIYRRVEQSQELQRILDDERNITLDLAERALSELVEAGNIQAIIFTLTHLGRDRGWALPNRKTIVQSPTPTQPVRIEFVKAQVLGMLDGDETT